MGLSQKFPTNSSSLFSTGQRTVFKRQLTQSEILPRITAHKRKSTYRVNFFGRISLILFSLTQDDVTRQVKNGTMESTFHFPDTTLEPSLIRKPFLRTRLPSKFQLSLLKIMFLGRKQTSLTTYPCHCIY